MPQSHEQGWIEKVTQLTEQVKHLRQENERLRQTIERHCIYESELKAEIGMLKMGFTPDEN